jgi:hypothetical protein
VKTGGSNYIIINGSMNNPVIGTYHLFPSVVASDLASMFEHGQRKIALFLWYAPVNFPAAQDNLWHHVCNSFGGVLCDQHQQNVVALLELIRQVGFNELHFRFGAQGRAKISEWSDWDGPQFRENWAFIDSVRNLVNGNSGSLPVVFDLATEHASEEIDDNPIHHRYCQQLWKLYTEKHGAADSCAFSILHGRAGLEPMLRWFKKAKTPAPAYYFFDSYGYEYQSLTSAAPLIPQGAPVCIEETYYNDATSFSDIKRAIDETGLNFQGVIQWPSIRNSQENVFPDRFPRRFDNYLVET